MCSELLTQIILFHKEVIMNKNLAVFVGSLRKESWNRKLATALAPSTKS